MNGIIDDTITSEMVDVTEKSIFPEIDHVTWIQDLEYSDDPEGN